ncbi:Leader peptidase PppA [Maioricimonas rarisocia]|uniref:Leader peptidase PppA n=1 Tax=Maioricimonas rarisocia TaxID=2528026 RepID=A0A517Z941_9PLAN|nr:prepilin peptidase [Maioricimonas rarisocia]QDU38994.1 Leader peptidase PppA [Maioricimonas rarisocia]
MTGKSVQYSPPIDQGGHVWERVPVPSSPGAAGLLQKTLAGQYLAMFLAGYAGLMALGWCCCSPVVWTSCAIGAAALWVMLRTVGVGARWLYTPVITLGLLGITLAVRGTNMQNLPAWLASGPFSVLALVLMLGVVLSLDILELVDHRGQQLAGFVQRHGLKILAFAVIGFIAIYALVVPLVDELIYRQNPPEKPHLAMDRLTLPQNVLFNFVEGFTGLWFLVAGTAVGSYLNVVIYRVPQGLSVVSRRSHCPQCGVPILASDNLPLIGWLRLNGRCRNCNEEISARYPIVELALGLTFLLLFFVELISGGTNLPVRTPYSYAGVLWILFYTKWDLVGLYAYHCFLLCSLFSWAMIRRDGQHVPARTSAIILAVTIIAPLLQPHLLPWPFDVNPTLSVTYTVRGAAITSALGLLAGGVVSLLPALFRWTQQEGGSSPLQFDRASWLLIGAGLGWQAAVSIFALLVIWMIGCGVLSPSRLHFPRSDLPDVRGQSAGPAVGTELQRLALPCVVLVHQCFWRQLAGLYG